MSILLENLTKRYDGHPVVNNVSLEIGDGEFFVLLGSSGSGKTTVLSLIAGLTTTDSGRILLHGRDVTYLPTQQRRVGFVFQNYALFQYMNIAENIEFGLRIRKVAAPERRRKRDELLELVGLAGLGNRMPRQLSGGQQQRVALARALAYGPDVLLLDEPLGALDAKIRIELRRNLKSIQRKLGIATIFVTHDQEEAFDLADRVGVMSFGRLLEVGSPEELYMHPKTEFVASFLGTANLLVGNIGPKGVQVGSLHFPPSSENQVTDQDRRVQVLFRPEDVALASEPGALGCPGLGQAEVEEIGFGGAFERLRLRLPPIPGVRPISPPVTFGSNSILVDASRSPEQASRFPLRPGAKTWVGVHRIHALAHPGLSILIVTDGSLRAQAALALGGQISRLAHARVTLLGCGKRGDNLHEHLQEARKQLGSGLAALDVQTSFEPVAQAVLRAAEVQPCDMVVMGFNPEEDLSLAEEVLQAGEHHLLLLPCPQPPPSQALICVASGEPGKDDVLFAGRFVRHLGAEATLLSIPADSAQDKQLVERTERFLEGGVQSLSILGVPARTLLRFGDVAEQIKLEVKNQSYDLLVLGAPLAGEREDISLSGVVEELLTAVRDRAIMIVRSHLMGGQIYPLIFGSWEPAPREMLTPAGPQFEKSAEKQTGQVEGLA
jgi:sulfate transport system ATP-binding protein